MITRGGGVHINVTNKMMPYSVFGLKHKTDPSESFAIVLLPNGQRAAIQDFDGRLVLLLNGEPKPFPAGGKCYVLEPDGQLVATKVPLAKAFSEGADLETFNSKALAEFVSPSEADSPTLGD